MAAALESDSSPGQLPRHAPLRCLAPDSLKVRLAAQLAAVVR
jgi:hypothetical protein